MVDNVHHKSPLIELSRLILPIVAFFLLTCQDGHASSVLLRAGTSSSIPPFSVDTFGGRVSSSTSPAKPATPLTVVWLLDTLEPEARSVARSDLLLLYTQLRTRPLRLAVIRGGAVELLGPFVSRLQLERALASIESPINIPPGAALLDQVNADVAQLGSKWSPVLLVGNLPRLDPQVESYAEALLARSFAMQQIRVFLMDPSGSNAGWSPLFQSSAGSILSAVGEFNSLVSESGQQFIEVTWTATPPSAGFVVHSAEVRDAQANLLVKVPELVNADAALPTVGQYATMQQELAPAAGLLRAPPDATSVQRLVDLLRSTQEVNPADPIVLRMETILGEKGSDFPGAVKAATLLTQVLPEDAGAFVLLGQALVQASNFDQAEAALNRAAALKAPPQQLAEQYARVYLGRNQERRALPYLQEALGAENQRQDLWFLLATVADHLQDSPIAIHSLEQGLALGGVHLDASGSLLRFYLAAHDSARARTFAAHTLETLPPDAASRSQFAEVLDNVGMPGESLAAWRSVLAVQPDAERAQVRTAQLLLDSRNAKGSEEAAERGLQILPKSAALYLAKADAIRQQGRAYEARSTLEEGVSATGDIAVLSRLASEQEAFGDRAAEVYFQLANVLGKASPERLHALERGFTVALRDDNLKQAALFAAELESEGRPEYRVMLGASRKVDNDAVVPGGLAALGYIARLGPDISPDRFFAEFARMAVANVCSNCMGDHFTGLIQSYFATISQLESLGTRDGDKVSIKLSMNGKEERNHTQNVLKLLGLQMHLEKGQLRLDRGEKESEGRKQDLLSALAFDEVGLQEALQAGKSFEFEMHDELAAVYPSARMWKDSFPKIEQNQFPLMLLHSPQIARLYIGISTVNRPTLRAMLGTSGIYWFLGRAADLLSLYGTSFALEGTRASVPGGTAAESVWSQMAGATPADPRAFFQALLQQKSSSMLAYFYTLSNLDRTHQAFLTANPVRAKRFYELFASLPESGSSPGAAHDSTFTKMMRSLPIDDDGHVSFPGSAEVWTIAKGSTTDDKHLAKMMKKVSRTAAPEVEDEILLRLTETHYKTNSVHSNELDNFLAVSHIDAHRSKPLDEESALLLAQRYGEFAAAYPYFTDLPAIDLAGFRSFFNVADRIGIQPVPEQNIELGQLHSLIEWVVLMDRRHVIEEAEAARLFASICERLAAAGDEAAFTLASMDLVKVLLSSCDHGASGKWDDRVRACLVGEANGARAKDYEIILDEQKAPSLDVLRSICLKAREALDANPGSIRLAAIEKGDATLPSMAIPKQAKLAGTEKQAMLSYDPTIVQKLVDEWNQNAGRPSQNMKKVQKLASDLLKAIEPQITLALSAPVYAYFLRSSDLVVSEDPLLLRKHRYLDFTSSSGPHRTLQESAFTSTSDGLGSYLEGGFFQFGLAAGFAAASGWKQAGVGGPAVVAEQIAAIRSTTWDRLLESDQRLVTLRVLAAREWILQSAQDPVRFSSLSEETSGLLSLSRRASLLNAIEERDWQRAWASITLPDLFRLGGSYLKRDVTGPAPSPTVAQLRLVSATNDGSRLDMFGRIPNHVLGCSHTHIVPDAPYEEYEREMMPIYLAERTAEFKLFLAYRADSIGVQPSDLSGVAEKLAAKAFTRSLMINVDDWPSLLHAYASITNENLKSVLEQ